MSSRRFRAPAGFRCAAQAVGVLASGILAAGILAGGIVAGGIVAGGDARAAEDGVEVVSDVAAIESFHSAQLAIHGIAGNPAVFIFDFPTLEQQGRMFSRILALIERQGGERERVLTDAELDRLIKASGKGAATYAYGNDFRVGELVKFFNMASDDRIALNEDEGRLRDFLLASGAMARKFEFYNAVPPDRVVISIPQSARAAAGRVAVTPQLRTAILHHELSHGEFYSNDAYADYCRRFWAGVMSEGQRAAFRRFLTRKGYDPGNTELIINETQAYLIHTPSQAIFSPAKVGLTAREVETLVNGFWAGKPPGRLFPRDDRRSH